MAIDESTDYGEEWYVNSNGFKLFACRWLPPKDQMKALVFLCHGYGVECSVYLEDIATSLAKAGFGVFGLDYQGHGKSEGLRCHIPSFHQLVLDCTDYFSNVKALMEFNGKPSFLLGESMGGAVALLIHKEQPTQWNGVILVAPMCKISKEMLPSPIVKFILIKMATVFPTWKIVPTQSILDTGFQDPVKREKARANPYAYNCKPRLKTAVEMLNTSLNLEKHLNEISLPFLVLHGKLDVVTDPSVSKGLYESAMSTDKKIKIYQNMWHALITGESDTNTKIVFNDIIAWLNHRSPKGATHSNSPSDV